MSTQAQILANQANAQSSTGPTSEAGKAKSTKNNFRHGLTGPFFVLDWESQEDYETLKGELFAEHQPTSPTESLLVEDMAQSQWLRKRAKVLQNYCLNQKAPVVDYNKDLALLIRYQTTHDRAFYKALNQLLKLRADKNKEEIGFVSQGRKEAQQARRELRDQRQEAQEKRREAEEIRRQEMHKAKTWVLDAKARCLETKIMSYELDQMPAEAA